MEKYAIIIVVLLTLIAAACLALNSTFGYVVTIWVAWLLFLKHGLFKTK